MAKQRVAETDGDNLHDEGYTFEDNKVDDSSVEKQPVNQASTNDQINTEVAPKLTFTHEELLQEQANDPEIQQLCHYVLNEHNVDTVPRGY